MELSTSASLIAGAVATGVLIAFHLFVPAVRGRLRVSEHVAASIGGGVAVAYVFLHLLPELARGNEHVGEALGDATPVTPLIEVVLFGVALVGFLTLFGLERLAADRSRRAGGSVFGVHLGAYALYNAVVTYSLPLQFRTDVRNGVLFTLAMGLHLVLTDRTLDRHHGDRFRSTGRWVLAGSLALGFALAWVAAPTRVVVVSLLTAVLAGFVLYNVFGDELPGEHETRYPAFVTSAGIYGGLLLAMSAGEG